MSSSATTSSFACSAPAARSTSGARGIAEIHLVAEPAHHFHLAGIALQRGERDAVHAQHAADDLPEAAEAGR